jgi:hypothetical protein
MALAVGDCEFGWQKVCVIWNEEIVNGGEQRNKMLQAPH